MAKEHDKKTNALRELDAAKLPYRARFFEADGTQTGVEIARMLGLDEERVFKTLVLRGDRTGVLICVVPGDAEVDLKAAARASGNKSVEMLHMKDLLPTTGYIRGGCSPIGMKKSFPTYIHSTCRLYDSIYVSAGVRGLQIRIAPDDLIRTTDASVVDLTV